MLKIFANRTYACLFAAQIVALLGTGLLTVALGLMAYDLAGDAAGVVLGTALSIKMIAYVGFSPIASAWFARYDRKKVLIGADLVRAAIALLLPFVDATWQIYVLIFLLQAASATFTPAFQAVIPDILKDEKDYTKALSLSRLAYDLENIISPTLAGLLLLVLSYHWLFVGTVVGFAGSIFLILTISLPVRVKTTERSFADRLTRGGRIYLATPRLRGLLALNFAAAAASAMVIVNTVVIARSVYGGSESDVALTFGAYGAGSMIAALLLPSLIERSSDRAVMFTGAIVLSSTLAGFGAIVYISGWVSWPAFLATWLFAGVSYAAILTPAGRLLRRSSHKEDHPALFAAQFAFSHACWLVTYPLAGVLGLQAGLDMTMIILGLLAWLAVVAGYLVWPKSNSVELEHSHDDLPDDHSHLQQVEQGSGPKRHRHAFVIDDEHRVWPTHG
jgi:MFS family permease